MFCRNAAGVQPVRSGVGCWISINHVSGWEPSCFLLCRSPCERSVLSSHQSTDPMIAKTLFGQGRFALGRLGKEPAQPGFFVGGHGCLDDYCIEVGQQAQRLAVLPVVNQNKESGM